MKDSILKIALFALIFLAIPVAHSQSVPGIVFKPAFSNSYRIYPSQVNQTEVFITKSPLDQDILFSACNTLNFIPFFISEGIYVSTNGGDTWRGNDTCTGSPIAYHGGDAGITIDKNGTFLLTRLGRSPFVGLYSHYSLDNGLTWSAQQVISTDDLERAALTSDVEPGSVWYGRSYAAWVKFALPYPLMFSFTDDAGQHWSAPKAINSPPVRSAGGDIAVGLNGKLYACWAGVTDFSPFMEIHVGFARSLNGGEDWTVSESAFAMSGISGILSNKSNIRVNSLPTLAIDTTNGPYRGRIYIITTQKGLSPAGTDPDIILNRSTDGGTTWLPGIRVNQDALNNGKTQYFPALHIDRFGAVNILFYDDRNTTNDSTSVFLARSTDGGENWHEFEISDHNFKPIPIGGLGQGYQGDMIDLTSTESRLWPVWMDNSSGVYQIWTVPVDFSEVGIVENVTSTPVTLSVVPNPAKHTVEIQHHIPVNIRARIVVTDCLGRKVAGATPAQGAKSCSFNCESWPAGIYQASIVLPNGAATAIKFAVYH
jgi:hypothetical protein